MNNSASSSVKTAFINNIDFARSALATHHGGNTREEKRVKRLQGSAVRRNSSNSPRHGPPNSSVEEADPLLDGGAGVKNFFVGPKLHTGLGKETRHRRVAPEPNGDADDSQGDILVQSMRSVISNANASPSTVRPNKQSGFRSIDAQAPFSQNTG